MGFFCLHNECAVLWLFLYVQNSETLFTSNFHIFTIFFFFISKIKIIALGALKKKKKHYRIWWQNRIQPIVIETQHLHSNCNNLIVNNNNKMISLHNLFLSLNYMYVKQMHHCILWSLFAALICIYIYYKCTVFITVELRLKVSLHNIKIASYSNIQS